MGNTPATLDENGFSVMSLKNESNDYTTLQTLHSLNIKPKLSQQKPSSHHSQDPPSPIDEDYDHDTLALKPKQFETPEIKAISLIPDQNRVSSISSIFRYKKQLGKGASCRVLLVEHKELKKLFALKEMMRTVSKNGSLFYSEVCILRKISHPNIVKIHDVYMDNYNFYICLQYCSGGTMLERIISDTHFSEQIASKYLKNILETIEFMHSRNIVHLDLKLNNIVFNTNKTDEISDNNNHSNDISVLKIIDFGLSEEIKNESKIYDEIHGSLHYFPPEIFEDEGRKGWELKKGDIWSVGIVSYLILSGKLPFYGNSQKVIINAIRKGQFDWPKNVTLSNDCKSFISGLLNPDTKSRFDATDALKHKWLTNNNYNNNLGNTLMKTLHNFNFKNQLQRILINSILSEMTDKEKNILINGIEELDSNKDGFVDKQDIMTYILKNKLNWYMKDIYYSDHENRHLRKRSSDILLEMKIAMELVKDSTIRNDIIIINEIEETETDNKQTDMILQNLMDEIEVDFKDYDFQQEDEIQKGNSAELTDGDTKSETDTKKYIQKHKQQSETNISSIGSPLSIIPNVPSLQTPIGYSSGDTPDELHSNSNDNNDNDNDKHAISVALFRKIMNKTAKKEFINLDGVVAELDPDDSGLIKLSAISSFGTLTDFTVNDNDNDNGTEINKNNSINDLNESTVILKPKQINRVQSNGTKIPNRIDENVEESDSEIDFPEHLFYVD